MNSFRDRLDVSERDYANLNDAWRKRFELWKKTLDPEATEVAGLHSLQLLKKEVKRLKAWAYFWLGLSGLLFLFSLLVAVVLVADVSSITDSVDFRIRSEGSDNITAPLSGISLLAIVTGATAWTGRRYQIVDQAASHLQDAVTRIGLASKLDVVHTKSDVATPITNELIKGIIREPLIAQPDSADQASNIFSQGAAKAIETALPANRGGD